MTISPQELSKTVQLLAEINRLSIKAFKAQTPQSLIFLILNDTIPIVRYDRAVLWRMDGGGKSPPKMLGVSGQAALKRDTDLSRNWLKIVKSIKEPEKPQILTNPEIPENTSVLWMPIFAYEKLALGLWMEKWNGVQWRQEEVDVLHFLMQAYGGAWEKFSKKYSIKNITKRPILITMLSLLLASFIIRIPLRVVAPCEVVPKDPVVVTAPLEGIIEKIDVKPGQSVKKGELLFEYDKRVPLQELRVAQKKVAIVQAEVDRANALAQKDKKALAELGTSMLKLKKEQLDLELAEFRASQLDVEAPVSGISMLDNPEEWHGKPVKIGEKVMVISNPLNTKVRMWIPEDDNIILDPKKEISIYLNINPATSKKAHLIYIANFTHVTDKGVTSFVAEAEWAKDQDLSEIKLGLKGTAILYGENVSLFYWIIRKPLVYARRFFGI